MYLKKKIGVYGCLKTMCSTTMEFFTWELYEQFLRYKNAFPADLLGIFILEITQQNAICLEYDVWWQKELTVYRTFLEVANVDEGIGELFQDRTILHRYFKYTSEIYSSTLLQSMSLQVVFQFVQP